MGKTRIGQDQIDAAYADRDLAAIAFEFSPIGLVVSECRVIRQCNPEFERMFGYERGELDDKLFACLYPTAEDFVKIGDRGVVDLKENNQYWDERVMARKDGSLFWCRVRGHTLTPGGDPLQRAVWSFADLSATGHTSQ